MIAIDTSSFVAFFAGDEGADVEAVEQALSAHQACLPPLVLMELLSARELPAEVAASLEELPLLGITPGYWQRAGRLRARILRMKRRARVADVLIAQSCIDHDVRLITRDRDFRHLVEHGKLRIL